MLKFVEGGEKHCFVERTVLTLLGGRERLKHRYTEGYVPFFFLFSLKTSSPKDVIPQRKTHLPKDATPQRTL